jgi:phosphate transport system ATP-binding protein
MPVGHAAQARNSRGTIEARSFSFWYGTHQALFDLSLRVEPGAITALIGPTGCGKSTLLRAMNRMNDFAAGVRHRGSMLLDGEDVHTADAVELRRRVGMVFQRWNPFPKSIYDNVVYGPRIHGVRARRALDSIAEEALRRSGLWGEVRDRLRESAIALSGGQQQRLCIARALANNPEVLLLDEPTSALDPRATEHIERLLLELRSQVTVVIVTHNLQQAARISDRTVFLESGRVVEADATSRIFTKPANERTEAYVTGRFG